MQGRRVENALLFFCSLKFDFGNLILLCSFKLNIESVEEQETHTINKNKG